MPKPLRTSTSNTSVQPLQTRIQALELLLSYLYPYDLSASKGAARDSANGQPSSGGVGCTPCDSYKQLIEAWEKALRWTPGLDHALCCMLASISSVKSVGDQLWIKVIGPASCGKSILCEAVSTNKEFVYAKSSIRGFHAGWKSDDGKDESLIAKLYGKTLVTKDGDTLLQSPNLGQILAEARDIYDGTSRTHYRNATSKDYEGVRMTWLLCGTSSLRSIDNSELGERFLDCVIMEQIDNELEDEILWRVVNRAEQNTSLEADDNLETHYEPDLCRAMQLTGGYVGWLRTNAADQLSIIDMGRIAKIQCMKLGKYVAHMRARPSDRQEENAEREFAARLVSQLTRLAKCLALVLNRPTVDSPVMERVTRVALDTSRGQTLEIVKHLYEVGAKGSEQKAVALRLGRSPDKIGVLLRFLLRIGVTEAFTPKRVKGISSRQRWRLTNRLYKLHETVYERSE